jgi:hypothetical protein
MQVEMDKFQCGFPGKISVDKFSPLGIPAKLIQAVLRKCGVLQTTNPVSDQQ